MFSRVVARCEDDPFPLRQTLFHTQSLIERLERCEKRASNPRIFDLQSSPYLKLAWKRIDQVIKGSSRYSHVTLPLFIPRFVKFELSKYLATLIDFQMHKLCY